MNQETNQFLKILLKKHLIKKNQCFFSISWWSKKTIEVWWGKNKKNMNKI